MKYFLIVITSFLLITGCGKSQLDIEKEKIQKEADELKHRLDSMSNYIDKEKKSLDSNMKSLDTLTNQLNKIQKKIAPKKLGDDAIKKTDELIQTEKPKEK
jgi:hypothetical protein